MSSIDENVTYRMRCIHAEQLINNIRCVSDLAYQQRAWVEESIPDVDDSWEECLCTFFDDINIDKFLNNIDPKFGLSQYQINELWKFRNKLRLYSNNIYKSLKKKWQNYADPRDILADPRWHEVVACAQETLKAFEGYEVPRNNLEKS